MSSKKSFTLMELLVVIGLVAILGVVAILLINPWQQIGKGYDAKRKHDMDEFKKALEDYYNDKGCYPKPDEVCYNDPINLCKGPGAHSYVNKQTCNICGSESTSPSFSPYLSKLPCDPQHKAKDYMYEVDGDANQLCSVDGRSAENSCPSNYYLYSNLSIFSDNDALILGCIGGGCGPNNPPPPNPTPRYGYEYGISSPNLTIERSFKYSCDDGSSCQVCNTYKECTDKIQSPGCYNKPIYTSCQTCCSKTGHCNPNSCP